MEANRPVKTKQNILETYDAIALHFDITRYKPWPETVAFAKTISSGDTIIDLGCGNGRNARYIAGESGAKVIGIDFSEGLLKSAVKRGNDEELHSVYFVKGDMAAIPVRDGVADGALMIASLHHLPTEDERILTLKEMARVMKKGAKGIISVWAREEEKFQEALKEAQKNNYPPGDILYPWKSRADGKTYMRFYHLFEKGELERILKRSGLEIARSYYSCENHYTDVIKL